MTLVIPRDPEALALEVARTWDGRPCDDPRLRGRVRLWATAEALCVEAWLPDPRPARVPDAPAGARVGDLWHYDVVECFVAGADGRYLEIELGAGGHFLVLGFDAPRRLAEEHRTLRPALDHAREPDGWRARIALPWHCVPEPVCGLNAFVIARGQHLAFAPLPGAAPDFHQPERFPAARVAST